MAEPRLKPLCEPDYLIPADQLPASHAPGWMRYGIGATLTAVLLTTTITIFGPMDETVAVTGLVRPVEQRMVHSGVEAILAEVAVRPNDVVAAGDVLLKLDPWEFEKRLTRLRAQLTEAQAALHLAEATRAKIEAVPVPAEFLFSAVQKDRDQEVAAIRRETAGRVEELQAKGGASILDVLNQRLLLIDAEAALERSEQVKAIFAGPYGQAARREAAERVEAARARVAALEAELSIAQTERDQCIVRAPKAGRVLSLSTRLPGELVPLGAPLVRLALDDAQELLLYATEDRLDQIVPGQRVRFQLKRQSDKLVRPAQAEVSEVAVDRNLPDTLVAVGANAAPSESYRVTARVLRSEVALPTGAVVEAEIIIRHETFWQHMWRRMLAPVVAKG